MSKAEIEDVLLLLKDIVNAQNLEAENQLKLIYILKRMQVEIDDLKEAVKGLSS